MLFTRRYIVYTKDLWSLFMRKLHLQEGVKLTPWRPQATTLTTFYTNAKHTVLWKIWVRSFWCQIPISPVVSPSPVKWGGDTRTALVLSPPSCGDSPSEGSPGGGSVSPWTSPRTLSCWCRGEPRWTPLRWRRWSPLAGDEWGGGGGGGWKRRRRVWLRFKDSREAEETGRVSQALSQALCFSLTSSFSRCFEMNLHIRIYRSL